MAKKKVLNKEDRLAALKAKMEAAATSGNGINFMSLKDGNNTIRILPAVDEMEFFYQQVGVHYFPSSGKKSNSIYCRSFVTEGREPCPVCELISELYDEGDEGSVALAKQIRLVKRFWMNVYDRVSKQVKVLAAGPQIFSQLTTLVGNPDYGMAIIDESADGVDIIIEKRKTGPRPIDVDYPVSARRKSTPLAATEKEIDAIFEQCRDLSYVEVGMDESKHKQEANGHVIYIIPYELAATVMNKYLNLLEDEEEEEAALGTDEDEVFFDDEEEVEFDNDDDDDEDDDEEEEVPQKPVRRKRVMRKR